MASIKHTKVFRERDYFEKQGRTKHSAGDQILYVRGYDVLLITPKIIGFKTTQPLKPHEVTSMPIEDWEEAIKVARNMNLKETNETN